MTGLSEKCNYALGYFMNLCLHHSLEISIGAGFVVFHIVGFGYLVFAMLFWILLSGVDVFIGSMKAEFYNNNFDSRIFGKALFKRSIILILGATITILLWHLSSMLDEGWLRLTLSLVPIGYFHIASWQEFKSILEQWRDIDPKNWMAIQLLKISDSLESKASDAIDEKLKQFTSWFYDGLSPNNGKRYLNR